MFEYNSLDSGSEKSFIKNQLPDDNIYFFETTNPNENNNISFKGSNDQTLVTTQSIIARKRSRPDNEKKIEEKEGEKIKNENHNEIDIDEGFVITKIKDKKRKTTRLIRRKYQKDLILAKVQNNYMTFIVKFLNEILEKLDYDKKTRFKDLDYHYKKSINKTYFEQLKNKKLYEVITSKVTTKNQTANSYKENFNLNLYKNLEKDSIIKNILDENYLSLFKKIYYQSKRNFNLKEYGKDVDISLSEKTKVYNDIEKNCKDKDYIIVMNKYVQQNYFSTNIFKVK